MSETSTSAPEVAGKPAALWEDFVDVFTTPSAVFARRRDGIYAEGVTLFGALAALVFVATRSFWQPFFDRQFEVAFAAQRASGARTPEQLEQGRAVAERFGNIGLWFAGLVGPALTVLFVALLILGAARVLGARLSYGQSLVVATMAYVPRLLASIVGAGVLAVKDATTLAGGVMPTSPAALLGPDTSRIVGALLGRFDPFVLWSTVLIGIGVAVIGRVSRQTGFTAAGLVWGVATIGALLSALRAAAAGG